MFKRLCRVNIVVCEGAGWRRRSKVLTPPTISVTRGDQRLEATFGTFGAFGTQCQCVNKFGFVGSGCIVAV